MTARAAYEAAVARLYALSTRGVELGLDRVREALALRGHPERAFRSVIVGGTNGKGSVSSVLAAMATAAGHRTGLYTSPHLHRFAERIRVDGRVASDRVCADGITRLLETPGLPPLTFFEAATLVALEAFRDAGVTLAVLEVGLGGRLDATNAVDAELAVITQVALDHEAYLGSTLAAIAREKAGILRDGGRLVHGVREREPRAVVDEEVARRRVSAWALGDELEVTVNAGLARVTTPKGVFDGLPVRLEGAHQVGNLALAVATAARLAELGVDIGPEAMRVGASRVRWPGRLERLAGRPSVLLDGAHNEDGARRLAEHLATLPRRGPRVLVFGAMVDKRVDGMLRTLAASFDEVVYVSVGLPRSASPMALAAVHPGRVASDVAHGMALAERIATPRGSIVVAGSLFVVADARAARLGLRSDPPIAM